MHPSDLEKRVVHTVLLIQHVLYIIEKGNLSVVNEKLDQSENFGWVPCSVLGYSNIFIALVDKKETFSAENTPLRRSYSLEMADEIFSELGSEQS